MRTYYRPRAPGRGENLTAALVAAGLAAGVAALSFYLTRLFLSREPLGPFSPSAQEEESPVAPSPDQA